MSVTLYFKGEKMKKNMIVFFIGTMLVSNVHLVNTALAKDINECEVPDFVEMGDLLHMDYQSGHNPLENIGLMNDHVAIYIGNNKFVHANRFSGVETRGYEYFLTNYKHLIFGYVATANSSQKVGAALWAQNEVGCRYQHLPKNSQKGSNNRWYDSELVWAAYYNQGIDIDENSWNNPKLVTIQEIIDDFDTETYIINPVPSYVQRGDIVLMDMKGHVILWSIPGYSNDHAAIYLGHEFRDGSYFIHASVRGVTYITYDMCHLVFEHFTFYYVNNANNSQIEDAIHWAVEQLGAKYQYFFPEKLYRGMMELGLKCEDPNNSEVETADRIYCTELAWAAYYNQGIDIDQNGWEEVKPVPNNNIPRFFRNLWDRFGWTFAYVNCDDISTSENTTQRPP